jgi:hypothetical protein
MLDEIGGHGSNLCLQYSSLNPTIDKSPIRSNGMIGQRAKPSPMLLWVDYWLTTFLHNFSANSAVRKQYKELGVMFLDNRYAVVKLFPSCSC